MGCTIACMSNENEVNNKQSIITIKWKKQSTEKTTKSSELKQQINENEVDMSHFKLCDKVIGLGGFGMVRVVKKITGDNSNQYYALKSLNKEAVLQRTSGPSAVMTELHSLALLKGCKFICNMHYAFQDENLLYMIVDLAKGGDMRYNLRIVHNNRFTETVAKFFFCQIALAVSTCHNSSILHRDIKPENIVMVDNGYVKLTDFGVAKILHDIEDCRSTSGTHGYMAPEIYMGQHRHGTASDWFSLGVTLYELLLGRRPYDTKQLMACRENSMEINNLLINRLDKINFISDNCKDFLYSILEVKSSRRLGSKHGIKEIKHHRWLRSFDWDSLSNLTYPSPYKPDINKDRFDIRGEEIKKSVKSHLLPSTLTPEEQLCFSNYEYNNHIYDPKCYSDKYISSNISNKNTLYSEKSRKVTSIVDKGITTTSNYNSAKILDNRNDILKLDFDESVCNLRIDTYKKSDDASLRQLINSPDENVQIERELNLMNWNKHLKSSSSIINSKTSSEAKHMNTDH